MQLIRIDTGTKFVNLFVVLKKLSARFSSKIEVVQLGLELS